MIHRGVPLGLEYNQFTNSFSNYIENLILKETDSGHRIPILFNPNSISDSISASYNQQAIPGGSAPVITYTGTGARMVSIEFSVPIHYLPPNTQFKDTEEYLNALRALVYPKYKNSLITPPNCKLHLTNLELEGVCTQCNISYDTDKGYGSDGAVNANVSLSFMEVLKEALSALQVSGKTTVLQGTQSKIYAPRQEIKNSNAKNTKSTKGTFTGFSLKGSTFISTDLEKIGNMYRPDYTDEGYNANSGDFDIVRFTYTSTDQISFTGNDIYGENGKGKSSTYKICINGESYNNSTRVLSRNNIPTYSYEQIVKWVSEMTFSVYVYYIYVPYINLSEYLFDKAQIRTIKVKLTGVIN